MRVCFRTGAVCKTNVKTPFHPPSLQVLVPWKGCLLLLFPEPLSLSEAYLPTLFVVKQLMGSIKNRIIVAQVLRSIGKSLDRTPKWRLFGFEIIVENLYGILLEVVMAYPWYVIGDGFKPLLLGEDGDFSGFGLAQLVGADVRSERSSDSKPLYFAAETPYISFVKILNQVLVNSVPSRHQGLLAHLLVLAHLGLLAVEPVHVLSYFQLFLPQIVLPWTWTSFLLGENGLRFVQLDFPVRNEFLFRSLKVIVAWSWSTIFNKLILLLFLLRALRVVHPCALGLLLVLAQEFGRTRFGLEVVVAWAGSGEVGDDAGGLCIFVGPQFDSVLDGLERSGFWLSFICDVGY